MDLVEAESSFGKSLSLQILVASRSLTYVFQVGDILTEILVGYPQANLEVQGLKYSPITVDKSNLQRNLD
jgi:hypothetical protein